MPNPRDTANYYTRTNEEIGGFIGTTYQMGGHIKRAIENMKTVMLARPEEPITREDVTIYPIYK